MLVTLEFPASAIGHPVLEVDGGRSRLVQSDFDYPGVASRFGWIPCECGETDGTVDCSHRTSSEMIGEAYEFLRKHEGESFEDDEDFYFESED